MSVFDTKQTTNTTLPTWFSNAQQGIASQAGAAMGQTMAPGQTVGQGVVNSLSGDTNPFTSAMGTLQTVAQGNANPWLPNGQPNQQTALGGLFSAQNAKLDQILPQIAAKEGAAGIGSGNFGSLRGQTAVDTARAGALTTLAEQQNKAALDAQTQAIQAAQGVGNVGSQYGTTGLNTANWQMSGGLPTLAKYSDIINSMGTTANKTSEQVNSGSQYDNWLKGLKTANDVATGGGNMGWLQDLLKGGLSAIGSNWGSTAPADIGDQTFPVNPDIGNNDTTNWENEPAPYTGYTDGI